MHLDDKSGGPEILFGSTRNYRRNEAGNEIYLWKVELDATSHDPIPGTVFCSKIKRDDIKDEGHIIGLKQTLVGGDLHGIWWQKDRIVHYFVYDWTFSAIKSTVIHDKVNYPAFALFSGSQTVIDPRLGLTIYQGYIGATKKEFDRTDG